MQQLQIVICYELTTGKVLFITNEYIEDGPNNIIQNKDFYIENYFELRNKLASEIDLLHLDYKTYKSIFNNAKSYKVNLDSKQLDVIYYTEDELKTIEQQNQEAEALNNRVSDISTYLNNTDESIISSVEDTILGVESNKISEENGGM